jgi:hypothetical protein
MPVAYEFDGSILVLRMTGEYLLIEIRIALAAALDEAESRIITGLLVDTSASESIATRSLGDITSVVGFLAYHSQSYGRRAALVATSDVAFGVLRMADADFDVAGVDTQLFRSYDEGMRWLQAQRDKPVADTAPPRYLPDPPNNASP